MRPQKITPFIWFNKQAEEAINHYTSIFKNSDVDGILKFGPNEEGPEGLVKHAQFTLEGEKL